MASTHMFESASNVFITGGSFIGGLSNAGAVDVMPDASTMLVYNTVSWNAILNSGGRADTVRCYPGTREAVMGHIETWIRGEANTEQPILWLSGPAGSGKSAIAQSIAERCLTLGIPMANFFFFRSDRTRNHAAPLVATLLVQMFDFCPAIKWRIHDFITQNPYIFDRSVEQQLKTLMGSALIYYGPEWRERQKTVLILDGLDECSSESTQQGIIRALHYIVTQPDFPFILLVSSRAEPHLTRSFNTSRSQVARLHLDGDNFSSSDDIRRFVVGEFNEIKETHHLASTLDAGWPMADEIESIVRKSSGHFIYAATIMRFLQNSPDSPILNLEMVKGIRPVESSSPFAQLDAIYSHILAKARNWPKTRDILAAQVLPDVVDIGTVPASWTGTKPRNSYMLDALGYSMIEIGSYTSDLTSLIEVRSWAVKFYHTSLSDFLLDKRRSGKFFIDLDDFRLKVVLALFRCASGRTEYSSWSLVVQHFDRLRTTNDAMTEVLSSPPLPSGRLAFNGTTLCTFLVKIEELYLETDATLHKLILKKWLTWFHTNHGTLRDDQLDEIQHANDIWRELAFAARLGAAFQREDSASAHTDAEESQDGLSNSDCYIGLQYPHINPHRGGHFPQDPPPSTSKFTPSDNSDYNPSLPHLPLKPSSSWAGSMISDKASTTMPSDESFEPDEKWKAALKSRIAKESESMFAEARKTFDVMMPDVILHADVEERIRGEYIQTMTSLQEAADEQYEIELQAERDHRRQVYISVMATLPRRAPPEAAIDEDRSLNSSSNDETPVEIHVARMSIRTPKARIKKDGYLSSSSDDNQQVGRHFTRKSWRSPSGSTNVPHGGMHLVTGNRIPAAARHYTPQTHSSSKRPKHRPYGAQKSVDKRKQVSHRQRPHQPTEEPPSSGSSARSPARMEFKRRSSPPDDLISQTGLFVQGSSRGNAASVGSRDADNPTLPHQLPSLGPIPSLHRSSSVVSAEASTTIPPDELFEPDEKWKAALKFRIDRELESMFAKARKTFIDKMPAAVTHADVRDRLRNEYIRTMASLQKASNEQYEIELQAEWDHRRQVYVSTMATLPRRAPQAAINEDCNLNSSSDDEPQVERHVARQLSRSPFGSTNISHEGEHLVSRSRVLLTSDYTPQAQASSARLKRRLSEARDNALLNRQRSRLPVREPPSALQTDGPWDISQGKPVRVSIRSGSECHTGRSPPRTEFRRRSAPRNDLDPPTHLFRQAKRRGSTPSIRSLRSSASASPMTETTAESVDDFSDDDQSLGDRLSHETSPRRPSGNPAQHHKERETFESKVEALAKAGGMRAMVEEEARERVEEVEQEEEKESPPTMRHELAERKAAVLARHELGTRVTENEVQRLKEDVQKQKHDERRQVEESNQKEEETRQGRGVTRTEDARDCEPGKMGEQEKLPSLITSAEERERLLAIREAEVKERERSLQIREAQAKEFERSLAIRELKVKEREEVIQKLTANVRESETETGRLEEEEGSQRKQGEEKVANRRPDSEGYATGYMAWKGKGKAEGEGWKTSEGDIERRARELACLRNQELEDRRREDLEELTRREVQAAEENARQVSEANGSNTDNTITEEDLIINDLDFLRRHVSIFQYDLHQVQYQLRAEDILRRKRGQQHPREGSIQVDPRVSRPGYPGPQIR